MPKSGRSISRKKKITHDNHVTKLYEVENLELPRGQQFKSIGEVRKFVNMVVLTEIWNDLGNVPNCVRVFCWGDSDESEARDDGSIWLARSHRNPATVLHELAHIATPRSQHGPHFIRVYISLVAAFMGTYYAGLLERACKRVGVKA